MTNFRMHVAINVDDLEKSLTFYRAFFGEEPTKVKNNYAKFELNNPPLHFSINVRPHEKKGVLNHLGLQVQDPEAVLAAKDRLQKAGLVSIDEMNTSCCYAVQDKIWVMDPEGNAWEVFFTKADSEFESVRDGSKGAHDVCCVTPSAQAKEESSCGCSTHVDSKIEKSSPSYCGA